MQITYFLTASKNIDHVLCNRVQLIFLFMHVIVTFEKMFLSNEAILIVMRYFFLIYHNYKCNDNLIKKCFLNICQIYN